MLKSVVYRGLAPTFFAAAVPQLAHAHQAIESGGFLAVLAHPFADATHWPVTVVVLLGAAWAGRRLKNGEQRAARNIAAVTLLGAAAAAFLAGV